MRRRSILRIVIAARVDTRCGTSRLGRLGNIAYAGSLGEQHVALDSLYRIGGNDYLRCLAVRHADKRLILFQLENSGIGTCLAQLADTVRLCLLCEIDSLSLAPLRGQCASRSPSAASIIACLSPSALVMAASLCPSA